MWIFYFYLTVNIVTLKKYDIIYNKLKQLGLYTTEVVIYGMGGEEPKVDNLTMENRQKNRRTEIYLIPGEEMINLALRGRLEIK